MIKIVTVSHEITNIWLVKVSFDRLKNLMVVKKILTAKTIFTIVLTQYYNEMDLLWSIT